MIRREHPEIRPIRHRLFRLALSEEKSRRLAQKDRADSEETPWDELDSDRDAERLDGCERDVLVDPVVDLSSSVNSSPSTLSATYPETDKRPGLVRDLEHPRELTSNRRRSSLGDESRDDRRKRSGCETRNTSSRI